jgi:hypothetical protein
MSNHTKQILAITILGIIAALTTIFFLPDWKFTNSTPSLYQAPLRNHDHPGRVPGYMIYLRQGYSLTTHDAALAIPVNPSTRKVIDLSLDHRIMYHTDVDDETLDAIRADPGVEWVECNCRLNGLEKEVPINRIDL